MLNCDKIKYDKNLTEKSMYMRGGKRDFGGGFGILSIAAGLQFIKEKTIMQIIAELFFLKIFFPSGLKIFAFL